MKVVVLGSTGLIGTAVGKYCLEQFGEDNVFLSYSGFSYNKCKFPFIVPGSSLQDIPGCDYVINCIGLTKTLANKNVAGAIQINSVFPRILANYCSKVGFKLIQVTTDCVFSGMNGFYTEDSLHDCTDVYGKSKSLGEPSNCMVLRTSVIGEEPHSNFGLISWVKSQKGKEIRGFTNHLWNGITTKQYAKICGKIIKDDLYEEDMFHIYSPDFVSKRTLVEMIDKKFNLQIKIVPTMTVPAIDRTLKTLRALNSKLNIPYLAQQIVEM